MILHSYNSRVSTLLSVCHEPVETTPSPDLSSSQRLLLTQIIYTGTVTCLTYFGWGCNVSLVIAARLNVSLSLYLTC